MQGAETLGRTLHVAARQLEQSMADSNRAAGDLVAKEASRRAPRRTGALAGSLRVEAGPKRATVVAGVRYAAFVNYGTSRMRPRPFLTGALDSVDPLPPYAAAADEALAAVRGA